ncbi:MAG: ATP-binding protein [Actinomycetota bacterium]|nr:ATP-binding protein [Actinomycetota bacterium]
MTAGAGFPFSAVVGHDDAKMALLLAAAEPRLGGVLLVGERGSAKTTLARGLAALLGDDVPFVELPLGASEDRVSGSLDLARVLSGGGVGVRPGLLAAAHGGVLYVDEVNLLADHVVDLLLDAAASGQHRLERDGFSHVHPADFVLVGSMNPEEGELRPQLADRFGLSAHVGGLASVPDRVEAVRRRLGFDGHPAAFVAEWGPAEEALSVTIRRLRSATECVPVPPQVLHKAVEVCAGLQMDGLRADVALARGAAAHAAWNGRSEAGYDDLAAVAPLVLSHRMRRSPLEDAPAADGLNAALQKALGRDGSGSGPVPGDPGGQPLPGDPGATDGPDAGERGTGTPDVGTPDVGASDVGTPDGSPPGSGASDVGTPDGSPPVGGAPVGSHLDGGGSEGRADVPGQGCPGGSPPTKRSEQAAGRPPSKVVVPPPMHAGEAVRLERMVPSSANRWRRPATGTGRGRMVAEREWGDAATDGQERGSLSALATARAAVARQGATGTVPAPGMRVEVVPGDLREVVRSPRPKSLVVMVVDASGSMGSTRMAEAKGAVMALLMGSYHRRDRVALVGFGGEGAKVLLRPTGSVEVARQRLAELPSGGATPLAEGLLCAAGVVKDALASDRRRSVPATEPTVVVVSDGRTNVGLAGEDPLASAERAAVDLRHLGVRSLVVDVEDAKIPLGLARDLAVWMGARYVRMGDGGSLDQLIGADGRFTA